MSDLNYRSLARLAYETHCKAMAQSGVMPTKTWDGLSDDDRAAWVRVVEVVTGTVAAADLA